MAFYVIGVAFIVMLSMNSFTNIIIPTYFQFIQVPIIETKFGIICIVTNVWLNIVKDDWNLDKGSLSKRK
jgi:hypothetical protein